MATVGPKLTIPHTVSSSAIVGQGNMPELWALYSTDNASVSTPTWNDATAKVRAFSVSRGRESELQQVEAGTASLTLDNRARDFDPAANVVIGPANAWWLREQFSGETQDIFKGRADSYDQQWPGFLDAITVVSCTDEFKALARAGLPTTTPPRASYGELVQFDKPSGYWPFNDSPEFRVQTPAPAAEEPTPTPATPPPPGLPGGPTLIGNWGDEWGWGW